MDDNWSVIDDDWSVIELFEKLPCKQLQINSKRCSSLLINVFISGIIFSFIGRPTFIFCELFMVSIQVHWYSSDSVKVINARSIFFGY